MGTDCLGVSAFAPARGQWMIEKLGGCHELTSKVFPYPFCGNCFSACSFRAHTSLPNRMDHESGLGDYFIIGFFDAACNKNARVIYQNVYSFKHAVCFDNKLIYLFAEANVTMDPFC